MRKIIAIGHQKNVGKDEFVKFCIDILRPQTKNLKIMRRGFADKLYEFCYSVYSWAGFKPRTYYQSNPNAKNDLLIPLNKTVRQVLIELGNHIRQYDSDIWINANLKTDDSDILFISDLRYPNEFLHCQANKALTIKIYRPGLEIPTDEADTALNNWDSQWDIWIDNDGDLNELYVKAEQFVNNYLIPIGK